MRGLKGKVAIVAGVAPGNIGAATAVLKGAEIEVSSPSNSPDEMLSEGHA